MTNLPLEFMTVRRAIDDIRAGMPVCIKAKQNVLIHNIEAVSEDTYHELISDENAYLLLSGPRARWLQPDHKFAGVASYPLHACLSLNHAKQIAGVLELHDDAPDELTSRNEPSLDYAILLQVLAERIPACIVVPQLGNHNDEMIHTITADAIEVFLAHQPEVHVVEEATLSLKHAKDAKIVAFRQQGMPKEHYAIIVGQPDPSAFVPIRVHSSSFINDLLLSIKSDCRSQLDYALNYFAEHHGGILLYLVQEGRGIGLTNVIRAYKSQAELGLDTVDANRYLGFRDDERGFNIASSMLKQLGFTRIDILSNNPKKLNELKGCGLEVGTNIPVILDTDDNSDYLQTKRERLGHLKDQG